MTTAVVQSDDTKRGESRRHTSSELESWVLPLHFQGAAWKGAACKPSSSELPSTAPESAQGYIHHSQAHSNTTFMFDAKIYSM